MSEFELSIKSRPGGSEVTVKGSKKQILIEFAMLAASIKKNSGFPLELLAAAVMNADEVYELRTNACTTIDMAQIKNAGSKLNDN